jgi:hypothetical protein
MEDNPLGEAIEIKQASEMKADCPGHRTWRNVVRSAEGRNEIVKGVLVRQINHLDASTPFVSVTAEEIVVAHRDVKQMAR